MRFIYVSDRLFDIIVTYKCGKEVLYSLHKVFASLLLFTVFHGFTLLDRTHISKIFTKWCAKGRAEKIENTQTSRRAPMLLLEFEAELLPFR
jgi:hypothetical protein